MDCSNILLINSAYEGEVNVAIVENSNLIDFDHESSMVEKNKGNVYLGYITSIEESLDAVFVDYGQDKHGFLPLKEISDEYLKEQIDRKNETTESDEPTAHKIETEDNIGNINTAEEKDNTVATRHHSAKTRLNERLHVGQKILVQVKKDERQSKGATLSTYIKLAGSYLVLTPGNVHSVGISKNATEEEKNSLKQQISTLNLPENIGVIIRTAGTKRPITDMKWELDLLLKHYENIQTTYNENDKTLLIHQESDVILRSLRDHLNQNTTKIVIDTVEGFEKIQSYLKVARAQFSDKLELYSGKAPLFTHYNLENKISQIFSKKCNLKSGGSIIIETTEALTSIDVNSSRSTDSAALNETALKTNMQAAEEIAKQLKLRDIGGIIVIDFIDMTNRQHRDKVEHHLSNCLKNDKARLQVLHISKLGLLCLSRQRIHSSLRENYFKTCPHCVGSGQIMNFDMLINKIHKEIDSICSSTHIERVTLYCSIEIHTFLSNERRQDLMKSEEKQNTKITILPDLSYYKNQYSFKTNNNRKTCSYKQINLKDVKIEKAFFSSGAEKPKLNNVFTDNTLHSSENKIGLIKNFWQSIIKNEEKKEEPATIAATAPRKRNYKTRHPRYRNNKRPSTHNASKKQQEYKDE
jgi:ribonuclease E